MAKETLKVPDIGGVEDAEVIEISVAVGDRIELEQGLIVLESDKASMEIPAEIAGTVVEVLVKEGDSLAEGAPIVVVETDADGAVAPEPESVAEAPPAEAPPAEPESSPEPPAAEEEHIPEQDRVAEAAVEPLPPEPAEPPIESLDTVEHHYADAIEDTGEAEVVEGELADEEEEAEGDDEDVLEETPEFLRDQPEDDELWFEQGEPKDFDF